MVIPVFSINFHLAKICAELHTDSPARDFYNFIDFRSSAHF